MNEHTAESYFKPDKGIFSYARIPTQVYHPKCGIEPYCTSLLTRVLTGDVRPEWIQGLGKMKQNEVGMLVPEEGYKDTFVSSIADTARVYYNLPKDLNPKAQKELSQFFIKQLESGNLDPVKVASALDLDPERDVPKIKQYGLWFITILPLVPHAVATNRKNQWNPLFKEGGLTESGQREWVVPNINVHKAMKEETIRLFKINPDHSITEWEVVDGVKQPKKSRAQPSSPILQQSVIEVESEKFTPVLIPCEFSA